MMIKIIDFKTKEIFTKLAEERLEEISELDKKKLTLIM